MQSKNVWGQFSIFIFFHVEGDEQTFVVVMKRLIDFDRNKLSSLAFWIGTLCGDFYAIKMNIKDSTTGCVSISTSEKFTLNE